jgi:hypothetical protein
MGASASPPPRPTTGAGELILAVTTGWLDSGVAGAAVWGGVAAFDAAISDPLDVFVGVVTAASWAELEAAGCLEVDSGER